MLSNDVPNEMLAYYRKIGVSYIFADDINSALCKLYSLFGIKKLLLEGGSIINGAFFRENCVDQISQVIAPFIADKDDKPLFSGVSMTEFKLLDCQNMKDGSVWIQYTK